ncbi:MAG: hypothetical protein Aureis2KO_05570 [Aureisphaera sp.]
MEFLHEIHLALNNVPNAVANEIDKFGFEDNRFDDQYRVEIASYRRTLHLNDEPSVVLWNNIIDLIRRNDGIIGTIEQEKIDKKYLRRFERSENAKVNEYDIPRLKLDEVQIGSYKKCDLHISLMKNNFNKNMLDQLLKAYIPYVERANRRIHTITAETNEGGRILFNAWCRIFQDFNVTGKLCMEYTVNHFRNPEDFPILPIAKECEIKKWKRFLKK